MEYRSIRRKTSESEDKATTLEILKEIGMKKGDVERRRFKPNSNKTAASKLLPVRITFNWEKRRSDLSKKKHQKIHPSSKMCLTMIQLKNNQG